MSIGVLVSFHTKVVERTVQALNSQIANSSFTSQTPDFNTKASVAPSVLDIRMNMRLHRRPTIKVNLGRLMDWLAGLVCEFVVKHCCEEGDDYVVLKFCELCCGQQANRESQGEVRVLTLMPKQGCLPIPHPNHANGTFLSSALSGKYLLGSHCVGFG